MSSRLKDRINAKKSANEKLLSIYVTAGFPEPDATVDIIKYLDAAGVDFIELGMPFSDPIADGPVIQKASDKALTNGITTDQIFTFVQEVRKTSDIPILLMGYTNTLLKYDVEKFFKKASSAGVDGLIIPDWPLEENSQYLDMLDAYNLDLIHLIAPNTDKERITEIDRISTAFVYCVAYMGVTGRDNKPTEETEKFLDYLKENLNHPWLVGFGVKSHEDYLTYTKSADGVIVGTAFINLLENMPSEKRRNVISEYIGNIRGI